MKNIVVFLFTLIALFLGLASHETHYYILTDLLGFRCPPHLINLFFSVIFFISAVIIAQETYLIELYNTIKNITQSAGKLAKSTAKAAIKASKNFNNIDDLAKRIENFVDTNDFKINK